MKPQDYSAALVLALVLFGTSGLGLTLWLFLIVPLCTVAWGAWTAAAAVPRRSRGHRLSL